MKIFAATILALAAAAINLKEGDGCGPMPEGADTAGPEDIFNYIDGDNSGDITEGEGRKALDCA